jgi:hypothetical protein
MRMVINHRMNTIRGPEGEAEMCGVKLILHYTGCLIGDESLDEWLRERYVEMLYIIRRKNYLVMEKSRDLM